jgi:sugar phosphate isomerase/epimerase
MRLARRGRRRAHGRTTLVGVTTPGESGPAPEESGPAVHVPAAQVGLSTASVYPESAPAAFEIAAALGYDGVEVMVWNDPVSQDLDALAALSERFDLPVLAVHAPCLVITQRVWSPDPWERLVRSKDAAERLGASTVVVHPPFRWQRDYARGFAEGIARIAGESEVRFAVENMFPLRARGREFSPYAPHWDPTTEDFTDFTLDISHTAVSRSDALDMADRMGDRLSHVHLGDGTGLGRDEHMVPGRGDQPCGPLLERLARRRYAGSVVVEVSTKRHRDREPREADLAEALAFARLHLAAPADLSPVP